MVLESFLTAENAEKHTSFMLVAGFVFAVVGAMLAYFLGGPGPSTLMVFLMTIPAIPLMYLIIKFEEKKDIDLDSERTLLKEHSKALKAFMMLFIGMVLGLVAVFVISPTPVAEEIFSEQLFTITELNRGGGPTGMVLATQAEQFQVILFNNARVLVLSIIFSFLFGAGAIFILAWNASVIAAAIGTFIRTHLSLAGELLGFVRFAQYFETITVGLLMYALHGIPEILAYFTAALAGGIISVAVIRKDFNSKNNAKIFFDGANLLLISLALLFVAAVLEVYVTPLLF